MVCAVIDYRRLESLFKEQGIQWKIDGELKAPTANDIWRVVTESRRQLAELPPGGQPQLEIGRLIVQKNGLHYDVYLHMGEI